MAVTIVQLAREKIAEALSSRSTAKLSANGVAQVEAYLHVWTAVLKPGLRCITNSADFDLNMSLLLSEPVVSMRCLYRLGVMLASEHILHAINQPWFHTSPTWETILNTVVAMLLHSLTFPEFTLLITASSLEIISSSHLLTSAPDMIPFRIKQDHIGAVCLQQVLSQLLHSADLRLWLLNKSTLTNCNDFIQHVIAVSKGETTDKAKLTATGCSDLQKMLFLWTLRLLRFEGEIIEAEYRGG
jgi:hypothetical protein